MTAPMRTGADEARNHVPLALTEDAQTFNYKLALHGDTGPRLETATILAMLN